MQLFRLKYRLPMQHSFDGLEEHRHHHVIEIEVFARNASAEFIEFGQMEKMMKQYLDPYQNAYLNEYREFGGDTTIENIGEVFYERLSQIFDEHKWFISRFEISETPLRVYAIVAEEF